MPWCAPGGGGTKADAVKAVRMCLDILELMKLDIANHQLQALRPCLVDTSGQYELDLVFGPPPNPTPQFSSASANAAAPSAMCPLPLYPETTYLDSARLLVLAADAADTAAMYMFLLLYRQLVFSDAGDPAVTRIIPE
ncbi:hypothetical protein EDD15DRAFT_2412543 [Pisolithus albus]|nr:hypothetical protein EDD15DRAFT_2412543 [Pisolithus albus]